MRPLRRNDKTKAGEDNDHEDTTVEDDLNPGVFTVPAMPYIAYIPGVLFMRQPYFPA